MSHYIQEINFGGASLVLETGEVARQADGAVLARMGDAQVLATVVYSRADSSAKDFFPLTVNYQERYYASGKIPGGFNKREGRPTERETLIARLIDRPVRPLFPEDFHQEVQVVVTVMSFDATVCLDVLSTIAASAALAISGLPFGGPIAAARVGYVDGNYTLNASDKEHLQSKLDLVVAGTASAILMVESEAKELDEKIMLGAVLFGHEMMQAVIRGIQLLAQDVAKPAYEYTKPVINKEVQTLVAEHGSDLIKQAYLNKDKLQRYKLIDAAREQIMAAVKATNVAVENDSESLERQIANDMDKLEYNLVRQNILNGEPRIDGRDLNTVRPIWIKPGFLARAHGSVLFTRGETQAIVALTLGSERDSQLLDLLSGEQRGRFMLHYNFPPYSVGEIGMMGSPKRREIGHGRLAHRAIAAVLPSATEWPYVMRIVSEITESNGSSSMASVCGASLALMDAGVPIKAPVAGVAMGLIKEGDKFAVITDILGDEDHLGDMDFKVAGTAKGITALQMDIKITGITKDIMEVALEQALAGRLHILQVMSDALNSPREELSMYAPRIVTMKIPEDKIRNVIGKGGAVIKALIEQTGVTIEIDDTGIVQLFSSDKAALDDAQAQIKSLVAEVEVGTTYTGKVLRIVDFGAFVNLLPGKDGLLHISQICSNRDQKVEEVLSIGQDVAVYVAGVDKQGRLKLEWPAKPASTGPATVVSPTATVTVDDNTTQDSE